MNVLLQDLRFAIRVLVKSPGFTAVALITLALGIGANTGLYTFLHANHKIPERFEAPEELVSLFQRDQLSTGSVDRRRILRSRDRCPWNSFDDIHHFHPANRFDLLPLANHCFKRGWPD